MIAKQQEMQNRTACGIKIYPTCDTNTRLGRIWQKFSHQADSGNNQPQVSIIENGEPVAFQMKRRRINPSVVGFNADGERLVGQIAPDRLLPTQKRSAHLNG